MKSILKTTFINFVSLYLVSLTLKEALVFSDQWETIALAAAALALLNKAVKPLIKLFFLPLNLLTLGMFRWLVNVIILFVLDLIIPGLQIKSFQFSGFSFQSFSISPLEVSFFFSLIINSFLLSLYHTLFSWLL